MEDRAFKLAAQFFGTVLLPRLGSAEKVRRIAPTEQVHLEMNAVTSFYYGVEVITCVVCTADVKSPRKELRQGINRYRVQVIHLKERNADKVIRALEQKQWSHFRQPYANKSLYDIIISLWTITSYLIWNGTRVRTARRHPSRIFLLR